MEARFFFFLRIRKTCFLSIHLYLFTRPKLEFFFFFFFSTRLYRLENKKNFYLNSPLIRHAIFSVHSFQDQSWSYKLYRGSGRILFFIQMCKRCQSHLKAEYSTVELATPPTKKSKYCKYVDTTRIKKKRKIQSCVRQGEIDLFLYERIIFGPYTVVNMIVNF